MIMYMTRKCGVTVELGGKCQHGSLLDASSGDRSWHKLTDPASRNLTIRMLWAKSEFKVTPEIISSFWSTRLALTASLRKANF